jgi:putative restriction endonuclease
MLIDARNSMLPRTRDLVGPGMAERLFGHVPGYPEGSLFENRAELSESRVHVPIQAGIAGSQTEGAESIVLSGGYEDDADYGDVIIYTGQGGRDPRTGQQTHDQPFTRGNRALALNKLNGLPVRVVRGSRHDSPDSPPAGYSYDGLYAVEDYWHEVGRSGFKIWRFHLVRIPQKMPGHKIAEEPAEYSVPDRRETRVSRIIRDSAQARAVKALYKSGCQMCGTRLQCPAGPYAEAAHIRPLGMPHNGPDTKSNILCLCPNHHVLFDNGAVSIAEDLTLIGMEGRLFVHGSHDIDGRHLGYHRDHLLVALAGRP